MESGQNMKLVFRLTWAIAFIMIACSCNPSRKPSSDFDGLTVVTVRDFRSLDGCGFLLEQNDGKFLQPLNMDSAFNHEGMVLGITFKTSKNPTTCMKGIPVELLVVKPKP